MTAVQPAVTSARAPDLETRKRMFRMMAEMRTFEERVLSLFRQNLGAGSTHLGIGQEAIAAGFGAAMQQGDYTFATYRGHNHTLARGVPMGPVLAELLGRANGLMAGKGGSMHLTSVEHGVMGSYAIVGGHLPIAIGAAWSAQYRGTDQATVAFFGDGTANIGAFHESLNFAAIWSLPVVFVCENNRYQEYSKIETVTAVPHPAADRASAYGLESIVVDGNDPDAVWAAASAALDQARQGGGPSMIETMTYRLAGHSAGDLAKYKSEAQVADEVAADPLPRYRALLLEAGVTEAELAEVEAAVVRAVDEAEEFARNGEQPGEDLIYKDVWADGGWQWRN